MSFNTLTSTEYVTPDSRLKLGVTDRFTLLWCHTDGDDRILFYTADFTTAIDVTSTRFKRLRSLFAFKRSHGTVSYDDTRSTGWVGKTFAIDTNHTF